MQQVHKLLLLYITYLLLVYLFKFVSILLDGEPRSFCRNFYAPSIWFNDFTQNPVPAPFAYVKYVIFLFSIFIFHR